MKTKILIILTLLSITVINQSCKKKVSGCTDPNSINFNPNATDNDGSCVARVYGCTDPNSTNYNPAANVDDGSCKYVGNATFWYNSNGTNATVYINGQVGYITAYYSTYNPTCGSTGCANFTLPVGIYSYTAQSSWNTWSGNVTVTSNGCALVLLQ